MKVVFFSGKDHERNSAQSSLAQEGRSAHEGNRSPQTTSEVDGTSPSAPKPPRRSNSDIANACATQHDNAVHQRLNQERRATTRISGGSDLAWHRRGVARSGPPPTIGLQRKQGQPSARDQTHPSTRGICAPWCGVPGPEQPRFGWHTVSVGLHRL